MSRVSRRRGRERGWSTVELMASVAVLVFGLLALAAGFHGSAVLAQQSRQNHALKHSYRNLVADLESMDPSTLAATYGGGSGEVDFWCGDDNSDSIADQRLYYSPPRVTILSGSCKLYTDERSIPAGWRGFSGGLDMNGDGLLSGLLGALLNPLLGLLGLGGGGGGGGSGGGSEGGAPADYRVIPAEITFTMKGCDGRRTFQAGLILSQ